MYINETVEEKAVRCNVEINPEEPHQELNRGCASYGDMLSYVLIGEVVLNF